MTKTTVFGAKHKPLGEIQSIHRTKPGDVPIEIDPDHISTRRQIRTIFEEGPLEELVADIRAIGQHSPAVVVADPEVPNRYIMVAGERRLRAVKVLGIKLKAFVRVLSNEEIDDLQFSENVKRQNLSQMELGAKLAEDYEALKDTTSAVLEAVAEKRRMSVATVSEYLNFYRAATGEGAAAKAVAEGVTADRQVVIGLRKLERDAPDLAEQALDALASGERSQNQRNVVKGFREQAKAAIPKKGAGPKGSNQAAVQFQPPQHKAGTAADSLATLHSLVAVSRRSPKTAIESIGSDSLEKARKSLVKHFKAGRTAVNEQSLGQTVILRFSEGTFGVDGEGAMNLLAFFEGVSGAEDLDLQALLAKAKK